MTPAQLAKICPLAPPAWLSELCRQAPNWGVNTKNREANLVAQVAHESLEFTRLKESLYYSDPQRIAMVFRSPFDLDRDRQIDPEEIEFAKGFVRQPDKLANYAYAGRVGNGPPESGDGYRYRGRGPIQISMRDNYRQCGRALGIDLLTDPDALLEPKYGVASALWFWSVHACNELADSLQITAITRQINGGLNGLAERTAYFNKAMGVL